MQSVSDFAKWDHIFKTQCAFRSSLVQTGTSRCRHLFTNTSECSFLGCPLVQTEYVGLQRDEGEILLIKKNSKAEKTLDTWAVEVLPSSRGDALGKVQKEVKVMHSTIAASAIKKFEHLQTIVETIAATEKMESDLDSDSTSEKKKK